MIPLALRPCGPPDRPGFYLFVGRARPSDPRPRMVLVRVGRMANEALVCLDDGNVLTPAEWGAGVWHEVEGATALLDSAGRQGFDGDGRRR